MTRIRSLSPQIRELASQIGEGVHASLRKYCKSPEAHAAWQAISAMPDDEWNAVASIVADHVVRTMGYRKPSRRAGRTS